MKKFWRSGMIDKKIVREREREEYINKLNRTILELTRENEPEYATVYTSDNRSHKFKIAREKPLTPAQSAKKWGEGVKALFTGEYDEVRKGNGEAVLDFYKPRFDKPKETSMKEMLDWMEKHLRDHPHYDGNIEINTLNAIRKAHGFEEK